MLERSQGTVLAPARPEAPTIVALAGLAALAVAMGVGRFAFTPILPMMQQDVGLSLAAGGWLASANYVGYLLGALAAMALRTQAATVIRAGLVTIAAATLAMGLADRFAAWLLLRALAGVASAWVLIFTSAWCLERLTLWRRSLSGGVVFAGVGTGIAAAGALCVALMQVRASSAQAWIAFGVLAFVVTAGIWSAFGGDDRVRPDDAGRPALRWNAECVRLVLAYGAFGFGYIIPATFLPVMARQVIEDPWVLGGSWSMFGAAAAVSTLAVAVRPRLVGNRTLWIIGQLLMALGVALPVIRPDVVGIILAALLVGGTFMVITMVGMQEARAVAGRHAATLMAAMTAAFATGQIVGPLGVSAMGGANGDLSSALLVGCALLVAGAYALCGRKT